MLKSRKNMAAILAVVLMLVTILTACSGGANENAGSNNGSNGGNGSDEQATSPVNAVGDDGETVLPYDPPVTITTWRCTTDIKAPATDTIEDNVHLTWAKEQLGITFDYLWTAPVADDACNSKMKLELASGQQLPDVIFSWDMKLLNEFVKSGQFQEIGSAYDQYANEDLKLGYEQHPNSWKVGTIDGERMIMPLLQASYQNDNVLWIRQDWFDQLNLEHPKTISELEEVMEIIKNSDVDGNGKNDTIPLAIAIKEDFKNMMGDATWIFGAYGGLPGFGGGRVGGVWLEKDGQLQPSDIQPEIKAGLQKLNEWYTKGYLSREVGLHNTFDAGKLFTNSQAAMIPGAPWVPFWPFSSDFVDTEAVYKPIPLPTGDDGTAMRLTDNVASSAGLIVNKDFDNMEALFTYLNRIYGFATAQPGSEFEFGFADGYDYIKNADGTISYPEGDSLYEPINWGPFGFKPQVPDAQPEFSYNYLNGTAEVTNNQQKSWVESNADVLKAWSIIYETKDAAIQSAYLAPPTPTMESREAVLQKLVLETYTKIIYGQEPVDSFDQLVDNLKQGGLDAIMTEVNEWYQTNR